jgi:hypothetical protein
MIVVDDGPVPTPAELEATEGLLRRQMTFLARNVQGMRRSLSGGGGWWLTIRGASHMNFCDSPLYSPVRRLTHAGPIPPGRALEIINAYVVSFFQAQLNGKDDHLLDAEARRYPEVENEYLSKGGP